jgi:hypothetical protein
VQIGRGGAGRRDRGGQGGGGVDDAPVEAAHLTEKLDSYLSQGAR